MGRPIIVPRIISSKPEYSCNTKWHRAEIYDCISKPAIIKITQNCDDLKEEEKSCLWQSQYIIHIRVQRG